MSVSKWHSKVQHLGSQLSGTLKCFFKMCLGMQILFSYVQCHVSMSSIDFDQYNVGIEWERQNTKMTNWCTINWYPFLPSKVMAGNEIEITCWWQCEMSGVFPVWYHLYQPISCRTCPPYVLGCRRGHQYSSWICSLCITTWAIYYFLYLLF